MVQRYNDVDQMIFDRWGEVIAFRESFDELVRRIEEVVDDVLQKAVAALQERRFGAESDTGPYLFFWKREWENRKKDPGVYLAISDFVPYECARKAADHPRLTVYTDWFEKLRTKESSEDFGRALRNAIPTEIATKWNDGSDLSRSPLVHQCSEFAEAERVRMVANPDALMQFLIERAADFDPVIPFIDQTLQKMTRR